MMGLRSLTTSLVIFGALSGCRGVARPDWTHPGTASTQQKRALRYDPYPESTLGGATMEGTRPREYENPPPEASRARWQLGNWGQ